MQICNKTQVFSGGLIIIRLKNPHYLYTLGGRVHSRISLYTLVLGCTQPSKIVHSRHKLYTAVRAKFPCTQPSEPNSKLYTAVRAKFPCTQPSDVYTSRKCTHSENVYVPFPECVHVYTRRPLASCIHKMFNVYTHPSCDDSYYTNIEKIQF